MGLFSRKKTRRETKVDKITATKIVKLTYLQSLQVSAGSAEVDQFSGLTGPKNYRIDDSNLGTFRNEFSRVRDNLNRELDKLGAAGDILGFSINLATSINDALFGKKVTVTSTTDIAEDGWTLVKTWTQPQFDVIRYALGIKELKIGRYQYASTSEVITKTWTAPKEIIKVRILANQYVPNDFPPGVYIEYYIKPNSEEIDWIRINPLELPSVYDDNGNIIPRIISFNMERPIEDRSEQRYFVTNNPVTSLRLKIVLKRPASLPDTMTPVVKGYRMLMSPRGGL